MTITTKSFLLNTSTLIILLLPVIASANSFAPLMAIPGLTDARDLNSYVNALFLLSISLAALLAVIKLVIAGAKYMLSDVVTNKQSAISDIKGAIVGLLIVAGTVVILQTINPNITNSILRLDVLQHSNQGNTNQTPTTPLEGIEDFNEPAPNVNNTVNEVNTVRYPVGGDLRFVMDTHIEENGYTEIERVSGFPSGMNQESTRADLEFNCSTSGGSKVIYFRPGEGTQWTTDGGYICVQ